MGSRSMAHHLLVRLWWVRCANLPFRFRSMSRKDNRIWPTVFNGGNPALRDGLRNMPWFFRGTQGYI